LTRPESASRTRCWSRTGLGRGERRRLQRQVHRHLPRHPRRRPRLPGAGRRERHRRGPRVGAGPTRGRRDAARRSGRGWRRGRRGPPVGFCRPGASPRVCCWYTVPTATPAS
jgi:hypothetical protein